MFGRGIQTENRTDSYIAKFSPFHFRVLRVFRGSLLLNAKSKNSKLVVRLLSWFATNARDLPWRRTHDPYAIWVSEIMLQQTQVKTVIPYWERWMRELPTIADLAKAHPDKIHKLWEGLGYYTRVRNMQKAAQQIIDSCRRRGNESQTKIGNRQSAIGNSETPHVVSYKLPSPGLSATLSPSDAERDGVRGFPTNYDTILALPGIGRYTAGAICSIAFNQPTPILDGNVIRVLTRLFGIKTNPREKQTNAQLWQLAEELVAHAAHQPPPRSSRRKEAHSKIRNGQSLLTSAATIENACSHLNQSLMELGALICTPRSPNCAACPVQKLCVARKQNLQDQLPNLGKRAAATERRFIAFIVERDGKFLVRQRPIGVVNAHLWEFPNAETNTQDRTPLAFRPLSTQPVLVLKHSITRYRITLEIWRAELLNRIKLPKSDRWLTPIQLQKLAFTAAHKKILSHVTSDKKLLQR